MIIVRWQNAEAGGSLDYLSPSLFEQSGSQEIEHETKWRGSKATVAKATLTTSGRQADIDYGGVHKVWNTGREIYPDYIRLTFKDEARRELEKVEFRGTDGFSMANVSIWDTAEASAEEGESRLATHFRRERDDRLRSLKLKSAPLPILCEVCDIDLFTKYGPNAPPHEVHHQVPISGGSRTTKLEDLAILCPNCHSAIHRTKPMMNPEEFRRVIQLRSPD